MKPISRLLSQSVSVLVPTLCAACRRPGPPLCERCITTIQTTEPDPSVDAVVLGPMEGVLRSAIHALKYRGAVQVIDVLASLLAVRIEAAGPAIDAVVPVPSQKRNVRVRGYDQAARLARALARDLGVAYRPSLTRRTGKSDRWCPGAEGQTLQAENVRRGLTAAAFALDHRPGDSVLLVDDVITTGATMLAAAKCLQATGVRTAPAAFAATVRRSDRASASSPSDSFDT